MTDSQAVLDPRRTPLAPPSGVTLNGSQSSPGKVNMGKVNILVVDDRPDKLLALESVLSHLGENLVKASSGKEALRHLLRQDFAVILLDVNMPGLDGFETAALIRKRLNSEHTPIIFVTAQGDSAKHISRGYSLGAVDYILDPIVPEVLKTKVSVFVELYRKTEQIKQQSERLLKMEAAEHKQRLTSVLEAFPDIVFVVGADRKIQFANPSAEEFSRNLGLKEQLPAALQAQIEHVLETGESLLPRTFQGVHRFRVNNIEHSFLPRLVAMRTEANAIFGVAVMLQDVTEFRLLDEVKTNLIATVSHEIKTPLTSMRTALLVLLEQTLGSLNQKQEELALIACDESERLLRTLNTLLDLTRFEEGLPGMRYELVAPAALISAGVEQTRVAATDARVKVRIEIEEDLPAVKVDRERIVHVFTNILTNAIKHSPENSEILIRAQRKDNEGVCFSVVDQGPGVPAEYQHRIFEKFFRVPGNPKSGTGLGLTIAREFIRAHGGTIGVNSQPGKGSEFYIILKKAPPVLSAE